jgi:hypothetical protein
LKPLYNYDEQIEDNQIVEKCRTQCRDEKRLSTLVWKPVEKLLLQNLDKDPKIIVKLILKKYDERLWRGYYWLRIGTNFGLL